MTSRFIERGGQVACSADPVPVGVTPSDRRQVFGFPAFIHSTSVLATSHRTRRPDPSGIGNP